MLMKPIEYGSNLIAKELDDKTILIAKNTTRIQEGNFLLEGEHIEIRAGKGVKVSSIAPNILVISCDTTKQDEAIYDLRKEVDARLKNIEAIFVKLVKGSK